MILTFRPIKVWPDDWALADTPRPTSPFDSTYQQTLNLLDTELGMLNATNVILQVGATENQCRADGQLRADARVDHPGVILSFDTPAHGTLTYACDAFQRAAWKHNAGPAWQQNLRAIALGLESLRRVERYGIANRGQQYAGYRELGSGIALGPRPMRVDEAASFIAEHCGDPGRIDEVADDLSFAAALYRDAAKLLHPDAGGDPELFKQLVAAKAVLDAEFGA